MTSEQTGGLLSHRPFVFFWISRVFGSIAFQASSVLIGWQVYERTGSAYALGFVGLLQFLPMLVLTFVVGHVADRYDRRRIVVACQALEALTLGLLTLALLTGRLDVAGVYAAAVALGAARAFESPTQSALLPGLVPAGLVSRALAASSSAMQTASIAGPALGGLLYAVNPTLAFGITALFFAFGCTAMAAIQRAENVRGREPVTLRSLFAGIGFIRGRPLVLGTISLDLFAVLLGGVTALLPIYAADILHTGPAGLGLLRSAPAVGGLLMALLLARVELKRHIGMKMFGSVIGFGLATIVFALSTDLVLSCAALFFAGAADNVSVVIRNSLVLLSTPDEMRGRVNAVNFLFIGTSNQLGEFESGMVAGLLGAVPSALIGGIGTVLVALLWMRLFPTLRKADSFTG